MDNTVALVQAYLHVNGYFTVAEYPIVSVNRRGEPRGVTDIDLIAWRFPRVSGRAGLPGGRKAVGEAGSGVDPELHCPKDMPDMLIAEVKRGRARFNRAMRDPLVIAMALARFGCCDPAESEETARLLLRTGSADTHCGHVVRLVAFGTGSSADMHPIGHMVSLEQVVRYLREWLADSWPELYGVKFSNPAMELLALLQRLDTQSKVRRK